MDTVLNTALAAVNPKEDADDADKLQKPMLFGEETAIMQEQNQTHKM